MFWQHIGSGIQFKPTTYTFCDKSRLLHFLSQLNKIKFNKVKLSKTSFYFNKRLLKHVVYKIVSNFSIHFLMKHIQNLAICSMGVLNWESILQEPELVLKLIKLGMDPSLPPTIMIDTMCRDCVTPSVVLLGSSIFDHIYQIV